jgi:hypothetical protein
LTSNLPQRSYSLANTLSSTATLFDGPYRQG